MTDNQDALECAERLWPDPAGTHIRRLVAENEALTNGRHELQAQGKHPAPCARFCEANAFEVEARELKRQIAEQATWKAKIIKAAEEAHGPAAFRFKLSLRKSGTATNQFPQWLDGRWVSFVYAEDDAHIGLRAKIEAQAALLRQALEAWDSPEANFDPVAPVIEAIRQHLEGKA